jgi:hypothetical protein
MYHERSGEHAIREMVIRLGIVHTVSNCGQHHDHDQHYGHDRQHHYGNTIIIITIINMLSMIIMIDIITASSIVITHLVIILVLRACRERSFPRESTAVRCTSAKRSRTTRAHDFDDDENDQDDHHSLTNERAECVGR